MHSLPHLERTRTHGLLDVEMAPKFLPGNDDRVSLDAKVDTLFSLSLDEDHTLSTREHHIQYPISPSVE